MIALIGIYRRELGRLLASSGVFLALPAGLSWIAWQRFFGAVDLGAMDGMDATFRAIALVLVPLSVWLAAPSFSVERSEYTAALWAISPVRPSAILFGKFLAILTVLTVALALLSSPVVAQLAVGPGIPWVRIAVGLGGLLLLVMGSTALTLLASSLVGHFSTAFIWGMGLMAGWMWGTVVMTHLLDAVVGLVPGAWLAVLRHGVSALALWDAPSLLLPLFLGWVDVGSVAAIAASVLLVLTVILQVVSSERWRD